MSGVDDAVASAVSSLTRRRVDRRLGSEQSGHATKTFVDARISIAPDATNEVGQPHTFTVTLEKDPGTGCFGRLPASMSTVTLTDSNGAVHSAADAGRATTRVRTRTRSGQCTITFTSNYGGQGDRARDVDVAGRTVDVDHGADRRQRRQLAATRSRRSWTRTSRSRRDGVNRVGRHAHVHGACERQRRHGGFANAPDGTQISFTIDSGPGAFTSANPCTTAGGTGSCSINLTSAVTGVTTVSAHTTLAVGGVSLTRNTDEHGAIQGRP